MPLFRLSALSSLIAGVLLLSGCVSPQYQYTATGAAVGATAGAIAGHQFDDDNGRYIGGAIGALLGGAIGNNADAIHNRGYREPPRDYGYNQPRPYNDGYQYQQSQSQYQYPRSYYRQ